MGIRQFFANLRMRSSGAGGMDEDLIENDEKGIEVSDHSPSASGEPDSRATDVAVADELEAEIVAAREEAQVSSLSAEAGQRESGATDSSPQPSPSGSAEDEVKAPVPFEKFKQLQEEKEELYDRLLRKQAEFENFRKRTEKEKQEFFDFALSNFIKDLLPVIDGLERGLYAPDGETVESYKKGIELILKQFRDVLATVGLQPIRAIGKIFDPNYHQAVMQEKNNSLAENEIIEELQRGYIYKDRLLRPSMVKVAVPVASETPAEVPEKD
ncbi:MAG: nucleotide exchange factor GrpE [Acidobacteria bacterium]|nr:MAG: nucleotide exchange factor GrpE [Acidobacteriota bacterium]